MNSKVPHLVKCFESQVVLSLTTISKILCVLSDSHCQARQSTGGGQQQREMESR